MRWNLDSDLPPHPQDSLASPDLADAELPEELLGGFEAAGVDLAPDEEQPEPELSQEEMMFEHLADLLIQEQAQSQQYQNAVKDQNLQGLRQADQLRRKLGS